MKIPSEIKLLSLDPEIEKYFRRRRIVQIFDREGNKYDKKWKSRTYSVTTSLTSSTKSSRQQWWSISWELCDSNTSSCTKHYLPSIQILKQDVINLFQNHRHIGLFGKAIENPHEHVTTFLLLWEVISHEGMSIDAFESIYSLKHWRIEQEIGYIFYLLGALFLRMIWCRNSQ